MLYGKTKCNILQWKRPCFKQFLLWRVFSNYTLESKSNKTCEYQADELDDNLIENNYDEYYPSKIKLMISREAMLCCKVRRTLRYHASNKRLSSEKFNYSLFLLLYPFRDEKEPLSGFPPMYQNKLQEQGVQDVVNINKIKFEPYGDLVKQAFFSI